jgi:hypothetical protein
MDRKEELLQEIRLRRLIRKAIELKEAKQRKQEKQHKFEENKLRYLIRHLILEGEVDADAEPAGYSSTPVNVLADALNEILKTLKHGLRKMKQPEERRSYRAHVLEKFKSIFSNFEGLDDRFKEPEKDPEKELENEFETFRMAGENPTGARFAFETINNSNIEQVLADKRKLLFTPEYRQEFKEYALYNIDLWLLTYEKEFADSEGQEPAFTETVMPKPSGAETAGSATEFEGGGFEDELEEILMMENEYVGE